MVCSITRTDRKIPFHVHLPAGAPATGFVTIEQVKSVDFRRRRWKRPGPAPTEVVADALAILGACLE